ncbi:MAG: hypothetical protein IPJ27_20910 [Candidatus Accumulibacter sp.]|uniref:Uncharacterized protein n=1 Tax=Candidatus Accumulibacter proximus TaxID=2954385 RepID=A0A935Q3S4_9PROT|nr:hypothetical protein [Candidatus Accumulibacter proximus]
MLLNIITDVIGLERSIYYRPHEQMTARSTDFGETFKPNSHSTRNALFGDIEALEKVGIKEPHEITYVTDSLGFRNPADYRGQTFVLVGDSFLAIMSSASRLFEKPKGKSSKWRYLFSKAMIFSPSPIVR